MYRVVVGQIRREYENEEKEEEFGKMIFDDFLRNIFQGLSMKSFPCE